LGSIRPVGCMRGLGSDAEALLNDYQMLSRRIHPPRNTTTAQKVKIMRFRWKTTPSAVQRVSSNMFQNAINGTRLGSRWYRSGGGIGFQRLSNQLARTTNTTSPAIAAGMLLM
jgi:hypothetical protein